MAAPNQSLQYYAIRVYAGPQQGAQLRLRPGRYVAGSGDEADLIFSDDDMLNNHAVLELGADGIYVEAREGGYNIGGKDYEQGRLKWEAGAFLRIGATVLLWEPEGTKWPPPGSYVVAAPEAAQDAAAPAAETRPAAPPAAAAAEKSEEGETQNAEKGAVFSKSTAIAAGAGVLLLLSGLIFAPAILNDRDSLEEDAAKVREAISAYPAVVVDNDGRMLTLSGEVTSHEDLDALTAALPDISSTLAVNIDVRDATITGVERTLRAMGFNARARYAEGGTVEVSSYMRDPYTEAEAFAELARYYPQSFTRHVLYKEDLEGPLQAELRRRNIEKIVPVFDRSSIKYVETLSLDEQHALHEGESALSASLSIPVRLDYDDGIADDGIDTMPLEALPGNSTARSLPGGNGGDSKKPDAGPALVIRSQSAGEAFRAEDVMGVTVEPMRFITLRSGNRYFEGGVLPSGWTVSGIAVDAITLEKDGESREFKLK